MLKKRAQCNGRPPLDPTLSPWFILPLTHTRSNPAAIAVKDGLIADTADRKIDVAGLYVTPGLIDIHMHACGGYRGWLFPDQHALP